MKQANLILFFFLCIIVGCSKKSELPDMVVNFNNGSTLNLNEIEANTILILYQPDCDHCQREAAAIRQNMGAFANYGVFFITNENFNAINEFAKKFDLHRQPNVFFVKTSFTEIIDKFGPVDTPSIYIYRDGHLETSFNGETPIEKITSQL